MVFSWRGNLRGASLFAYLFKTSLPFAVFVGTVLDLNSQPLSCYSKKPLSLMDSWLANLPIPVRILA